MMPPSAKQKVCRVFWVLAYLSSIVLSMLGFAIGSWPLFAGFKVLFIPTISVLVYVEWPRPLTKQYYLLQLVYVCAWMGDLMLSLVRFHQGCFLFGAISFLLQHNFYIWLNLTARAKDGNLFHSPYWGLPNLGYVVLLSTEYYAGTGGMFKAACMIYSLFLGTAFMTAFHREMANRKKYWITVAGFAFFVLSDLILAIDRFIHPLSDPMGTLILLTYYIAQTMICYGTLPDVGTVKN